MRGTMRKKFICPVCKEHIGGPVQDTEPTYNGYVRYRKCEKCNFIFVTSEKVTHAIIRNAGKGED